MAKHLEYNIIYCAQIQQEKVTMRKSQIKKTSEEE